MNKHKCTCCNGIGHHVHEVKAHGAQIFTRLKCNACIGGTIYYERKYQCHGKLMTEEKRIEIKKRHANKKEQQK